jgi:hypothetical protein
MSAELQKISLKITEDSRLRVGVLAALDHICERRGLTGEDKCELGVAIGKECEKILENQKEPNCVVTIDEMEGRMQVTVKSSSGKVQATVVKHFQKNPAHS